MRFGVVSGILSSLIFLALVAPSAHAALIDRVNEAFRSVYGRNPTVQEWEYWAGRVQRGEKTTFEALVGAMGFQKANSAGSTALPTAVAPSVAASSTFRIDKIYYPSPHTPNALPDGTLVTSPSTTNVYFIRDGKRSWVLPSILNRWFGENHFFKSDTVISIPHEDLLRYPQGTSVNKLYVGKVLQHPTGAQFYIDDKLRKRALSSAVRGALKFPASNLYSTSAAHIAEFPTGPAITKTDSYPGGMVIYDGPYHGGRIWKLMEGSNGQIYKHLYLKDRFYEADGYPDEGQRVGVDAATLARHPRGSNIDRYPDGWVIGLSTNRYIMQKGARRLITTAQLFSAMGYRDSHVRSEYPDLYTKYAQGQPIRAFKSIVAGSGSSTEGAAAPAPSTASHLLNVRPHVRTLIGNVNNYFRLVFDRDPSPSDNAFWVDYLYRGEVDTESALLAAMQRTRQTGVRPALTPRTTPISLEALKLKWLPYLFYFVHHQDPNEDDKDYWYSRITSTDRNTIEKLGGTIQWVKENYGGATRR